MKQEFKVAAMTMGTMLITSSNAWAATVYDKVELFQTETFFTDSFEISEAGAYKATLTDFNFPVPMIDIGMNVTTTTDSLGSHMAPGSFKFNAMPGTYFVSFFGTADIFTPTQLEGCFFRKSHHRCFPLKTQLGMYGIDISAVPVPASVWLFGSGLNGLAAVADVKHNTNSTPCLVYTFYHFLVPPIS